MSENKTAEKIFTRNFHLADSHTLVRYREHGGYAALPKALGMEPGQPGLFWERLHPDVEWDVTQAEGAGATYRGREADNGSFTGAGGRNIFAINQHYLDRRNVTEARHPII